MTKTVSRLDANPGILALLLTLTARQQQFELFFKTIQQIAIVCNDAESRWIFSTVQQDLPENDWFERAIARIRSGGEL